VAAAVAVEMLAPVLHLVVVEQVASFLDVYQ
jgi:hypothetical protein